MLTDSKCTANSSGGRDGNDKDNNAGNNNDKDDDDNIGNNKDTTMTAKRIENKDNNDRKVHQKLDYVPYYLDIVSNHLEIYDLVIISTFSTLRR